MKLKKLKDICLFFIVLFLFIACLENNKPVLLYNRIPIQNEVIDSQVIANRLEINLFKNNFFITYSDEETVSLKYAYGKDTWQIDYLDKIDLMPKINNVIGDHAVTSDDDTIYIIYFDQENQYKTNLKLVAGQLDGIWSVLPIGEKGQGIKSIFFNHKIHIFYENKFLYHSVIGKKHIKQEILLDYPVSMSPVTDFAYSDLTNTFFYSFFDIADNNLKIFYMNENFSCLKNSLRIKQVNPGGFIHRILVNPSGYLDVLTYDFDSMNLVYYHNDQDIKVKDLVVTEPFLNAVDFIFYNEQPLFCYAFQQADIEDDQDNLYFIQIIFKPGVKWKSGIVVRENKYIKDMRLFIKNENLYIFYICGSLKMLKFSLADLYNLKY